LSEAVSEEHVSEPKIIVALDYPDAQSALALAARLQPALCRLKVGKELFTAAGPRVVEQLVHAGFAVFLDLKFHDIPNTVAQACKSAAALGAWMINLHAFGGRAMMTAAMDALSKHSTRPLLTAVTVLTSMSSDDLMQLGVQGSAQEVSLRLAHLAAECGLDGVVCSPQDASVLRHACGQTFVLVTPGIRPPDAQAEDQKRIATPKAALEQGASYLVIGRPITRAPDPLAALRNIQTQIDASAAPAG
jgi:orotidine-5'-phosphate decarboxylase